MATTQDVNSQAMFECTALINAYGMLLPLRPGLPTFPLTKLEFKMGRSEAEGSGLDYTFVHLKSSNHNCYVGISKYHATIVRENDTTIIHDASQNGTFVNDELVGKNKSRVLLNGDVLAFGHRNCKLFTYIEELNDTAKSIYPAELKAKYVVSAKELGRGAMGQVMLAYDKTNAKRRVAIKVIDKGSLNCEVSAKFVVSLPELVRREIAIMRAVKHPNCIEMEEVFESSRHAFIAMELLNGGDFFDRIIDKKRNGRGLGESLSKFYCYQMLKAIQYLHRNRITHRDLKPENILLATMEDETLLKVSDFGLSKLTNSQTVLKTNCGTPHYKAPELLQLVIDGSGTYTNAVDLWSLGVILFTSLVGYLPFNENYGDLTLNKQIIYERRAFNLKGSEISLDAQNLIDLLLCVDPSQRLTADQALAHQWFTREEYKVEIDKAKAFMSQHKYSKNAEDSAAAMSSQLGKRSRTDEMAAPKVSPDESSMPSEIDEMDVDSRSPRWQ